MGKISLETISVSQEPNTTAVHEILFAILVSDKLPQVLRLQ